MKKDRDSGAGRPEVRGTAALVRATWVLVVSTWCLAAVTAAELLAK